MNSSLKVVILNDFAFVNGGAAKVAIESACELAGQGVSVRFLAQVGPVDPRLESAGVKVTCLGGADIASQTNRLKAVMNGLWNFESARALEKMLTGDSPEETIIHVHGWSKGLTTSVIRVARKLGFKVVVTLHDYFTVCPNGGFFVYPEQQGCLRKPLSIGCLAKNCDVRRYSHKLWRLVRQVVQRVFGGLPADVKNYIYLSRFSLEKMRAFLPPDAGFFHVPNPVSVHCATPREVPSDPCFVFAGRLSPEKGVDLFAEAIIASGARGIVIGDGPQRAEAQSSYPTLTFTGWLSEERVCEYMSQATALVFPSRLYETQGLVVAEAAALGVPSVVPDQCSAAEFVEDRYTGRLFRSGDVSSLAAVMKELAAEPENVARLGRCAKQKMVQSSMGPDRHVNGLMQVYRSLLES